MTGETLRPEIAELFRKYRESYREVFLDEIAFGSIRGARTPAELDSIYRACVSRAKELRVPTGRQRGRPRSGVSAAQSPTRERALSDSREHDWFRELCMIMGDFPANRPLLCHQIMLFIQGADRRELAEIRSAVQACHRKFKRPKRGRPTVPQDDEIMGQARQAVWMRLIEQRSDREIAKTLGMQVVEPVRNPSGLIEIPGNIESIKRQMQRLEDYLADAVYRAIPASHIRHGATGREIAPGALDSRTLQTLIRSKTGLPFRTHPEECKRIVEVLWPRGSAVDARRFEPRRFEREFTAKQKKRHT